jgi:ABC-type sugar transport system ATPase subunit
MSDNYALEIKNVSKSFAGMRAVSNVTFAVAPGEVVSLAGENGAGKSTIKNIVGGLLRPDSGEIRLFGNAQRQGVADVRAQGVTTVHQEISLFPHLTVAENILINRLGEHRTLGLSRTKLNAAAEPYLDRVGAQLDLNARVSTLSTGQTQLVEIAKALAADPRVLVLDEPTTSLAENERKHVFELVSALCKDGVAILYVSHFLDEIFLLSDRVVVLRDGSVVADRKASTLDRNTLEELMVGRELAAGYPQKADAREEIALSVRGISDGGLVKDVSFDVHRGEIFGLAGLMGAGRTEIARSIFGLSGSTGIVEVAGVAVRRGDPRAAIAAGIAFVTEDRRDEGIFLTRPIRETLSAATLRDVARGGFLGIIDRGREHSATTKEASALSVASRAGLEANGASLSGGNQQKVVIGKWLLTDPKVLILDEPTRGIDVGAKAEIYKILTQLAAQGLAVLMISSELEELLGLSHRIGVISSGALVGVLARDEADSKKIIRLATGGTL